jgi:hypothetical protein
MQSKGVIRGIKFFYLSLGCKKSVSFLNKKAGFIVLFKRLAFAIGWDKLSYSADLSKAVWFGFRCVKMISNDGLLRASKVQDKGVILRYVIGF